MVHELIGAVGAAAEIVGGVTQARGEQRVDGLIASRILTEVGAVRIVVIVAGRIQHGEQRLLDREPLLCRRHRLEHRPELLRRQGGAG